MKSGKFGKWPLNQFSVYVCDVMHCALYRLCAYSLGFFAPRRREQVNEAKFNHRGSLTSLMDNIDADADAHADTKSVASMDELYMSKSRPQVSKFCICQHVQLCNSVILCCSVL